MWLNSRGGRTPLDVFIYNGKPFITMASGGGEVFVEVPEDEKLKIFIYNGYQRGVKVV